MTSIPASAYDADNVMPLANAVLDTGTTLVSACPDEDEYEGIAGFYASQRRLMAICADGAHPADFTPAHQDTLRHEGIHLAQDCMRGRFDGELETVHNLTKVMELMSLAPLNYERIEQVYRERGADDLTIMLEFEAWSGASVLSNQQVAAMIIRSCRA